MQKRLRQFILIYFAPVVITIVYCFIELEHIKNIWLFIMMGFAFLIQCESYNNKVVDKQQNNSIIKRKFYFTYFYFFLLFVYPVLVEFPLTNGNNGLYGINDLAIWYVVIMLLGLLVYIFIISDAYISEISMGKAKVTMLKEKFEKDLDNHIDLTKSLIDKIRAEYYMIQNLSMHCQQARRHNGAIVDEFQKILQCYYDKQKEKSKVYVIENIEHTLRDDFKLREVEYKELIRHMNRNELYAIKTDRHYMFLPYLEESFEEILGEPLTLYIIVESEKPIIKQERYIILNILKEFYEKLLVNIYIE